MPRLPRLYLPGCAQHVFQRGNNREVCFCDESDYKAYLSFLKDAAAKCQAAVHAFVLMTGHWGQSKITDPNYRGWCRAS